VAFLSVDGVNALHDITALLGTGVHVVYDQALFADHVSVDRLNVL
jgi:hypothetical protein